MKVTECVFSICGHNIGPTELKICHVGLHLPQGGYRIHIVQVLLLARGGAKTGSQGPYSPNVSQSKVRWEDQVQGGFCRYGPWAV